MPEAMSKEELLRDMILELRGLADRLLPLCAELLTADETEAAEDLIKRTRLDALDL